MHLRVTIEELVSRQGQIQYVSGDQMSNNMKLSSRRHVIKLGTLALAYPVLAAASRAEVHRGAVAVDIALVSMPEGGDFKKYLLNASTPLGVKAGDRLFEVTADAIDDGWCRLRVNLNGEAIIDSRMGWGGYMWHRSGLLFMLPGAMLAQPVVNGQITARMGFLRQAPKISSMVRGFGGSAMPLQDARIVAASVTAADASRKVLHWDLAQADGRRLSLVSYRDGLLKIDDGLYLLQRVV